MAKFNPPASLGKGAKPVKPRPDPPLYPQAFGKWPSPAIVAAPLLGLVAGLSVDYWPGHVDPPPASPPRPTSRYRT